MLPAKFFTGLTDSHNFFHNETNINFITMNHLFCDETINCLRKITLKSNDRSPALYLSVKQIMDKSVDPMKNLLIDYYISVKCSVIVVYCDLSLFQY